jgi:hypothetical protein
LRFFAQQTQRYVPSRGRQPTAKFDGRGWLCVERSI